MKQFNFLYLVALVLIFSFTIKNSSAQTERTAGEVTFSFRTVTANGPYSPRHVLAVWVEDENGFVKSRLVRANNRKKYLYTWKVVSNENEVDAVTGATLNSHQTHTVVWDCTDLDGVEALDGTYTVRVEFTDEHAQGPLYSIDFEKGSEEQLLMPADQTYFKDIQLDFYPETTGVKELKDVNDISVYPNPGNGLFLVDKLPEGLEEIVIMNYNGKLIQSISQEKFLNTKTLEIDLRNYSAGVYLLKMKLNGQYISRKLIKK